MIKNWNGLLKHVFLYSVIYTVATIANSVLSLMQGIRDDPSGNWHEITRAVVVFIGVVAYWMATSLPVKNPMLRALCTYVPTMGMVFGLVWLTHFIEPLAKSAYRDIFINYTGLFLLVCAVVFIGSAIKKKRSGGKE